MGNISSSKDKSRSIIANERPKRTDSDPTNPTLLRAQTYAEKYKLLEPSLIVNSEVEGDAEIFEFSQKHVDRKDLVGIVVASDRVLSIERTSSDEASENGIRALCQLVSQNLALVVFHLNGQRLGAWRTPLLIQALCGHPSLAVVDLYDCKIDNDGARFIIQNLKDNPSISRINLGGNDFIDQNVREEITEILTDEKYEHIKVIF
eukprot:86207_1